MFCPSVRAPKPHPFSPAELVRVCHGLALVLSLGTFHVTAWADPHVSVVSFASPAYTQRKFNGGEVQPESYVFMAGRFVSGITVDPSIDRMSFRRIAESLAPELARQQYFPATNYRAADLLLVVHWGTTRPAQEEQPPPDNRVLKDATGTTAPGVNEGLQLRVWEDPAGGLDENAERMFSIADQFPDTPTGADSHAVTNPFLQAGEMATRQMAMADNMQLLGYARTMRRQSGRAVVSAEEESLRFDLFTERYFVVIQAFDLRQPVPQGQRRRPVWTVHLNMRSPGTDFARALNSMGRTAVDYFGRNIETVQIVRPKIREGKIELGEPIILGEEK